MADEETTKLATALRQAKKTRMFFAFVSKGMEGTLLVAKKKIPKKEIDLARKEIGGGKIFQGRCQGDDGELVFELAKEPPNNLATILKKIIKSDAGLTLNVGTRIAEDVEEDEDELEEKQERPGRQEEQDEQEEPEDEVDEKIPPPPPPPPMPSKDATRVASRLKALGPVLQKIENIKNPQVKDIKQAVKEANDFAKKEDYASANETLDIVESMVKEVLSSPPPPPPPPAPQKTSAGVTKRLNALSAQIKTALKGPDGSRVQALFVAVNGLIKNDDFEQANKVLDELEPLVSKAPPQEEQQAAPKVKAATGKKVLFQQSRLVYDQARKMAQAELRKLQQAILADPEVKALDDPEIDKVVERLADALADFDEELIDALDAALNATTDNDREKAEAEAKAIIKRYQNGLNHKVLQAIDDNGFTPVKIRATLETTLKTLASKLG